MLNQSENYDLNDILYNVSQSQSDTFCFTLNANDYSKGEFTSENQYMHCLCIKNSEIMLQKAETSKDTDKLYIVEKTYALLFRNSFFELQFKVLETILKLGKHHRQLLINENKDSPLIF